MEEKDEEQTTIEELKQKMGELLPADSDMQLYSSKHMSQTLLEHFSPRDHYIN